MNLLLIEPHEIEAQDRVTLTDRRAEHLRKVLKVEPGKTLRLGIVGGGVGSGTVLAVERGSITLSLEVPAVSPPADSSTCPKTDLIVAVPRPQALHRVLQNAASMGVARLDLVNAWRVEKSFFASPSMQQEKIRYHLLLGAEQGMTTWLPEVRIERLLVPFLERHYALGADPKQRLIAHPEAPRPLEQAHGSREERRVIAIGPEGGWISREIDTFAALGFEPVTLGSWILKVETALVAALAQLELCDRAAACPG